jgi:hypothetical protein
MKNYKQDNQFKATSQIVYSPPLSAFAHSPNSFTSKPVRPKAAYEMTDRQLLK